MSKFVGFSSIDQLYPPYKIYDIELVKRDLMNHFLTRRGERIMQPEFGSIIFDLLMDPFDETTKSAIIDDAVRIVQSDPRVAFVSADTQEFDQGIILQVTIHYVPDNVKDTLLIQYLRNVDDRHF